MKKLSICSHLSLLIQSVIFVLTTFSINSQCLLDDEISFLFSLIFLSINTFAAFYSSVTLFNFDWNKSWIYFFALSFINIILYFSIKQMFLPLTIVLLSVVGLIFLITTLFWGKMLHLFKIDTSVSETKQKNMSKFFYGAPTICFCAGLSLIFDNYNTSDTTIHLFCAAILIHTLLSVFGMFHFNISLNPSLSKTFCMFLYAIIAVLVFLKIPVWEDIHTGQYAFLLLIAMSALLYTELKAKRN